MLYYLNTEKIKMFVISENEYLCTKMTINNTFKNFAEQIEFWNHP